MDERKKIVLATEDIIAKNIEDIYINVNLQQKFNILKKEKFDNNFDLAEQFRRERNASRDFRIYGIIDSKIIDSDNVTIKVYSEEGTVGGFKVYGGLVKTVTSQPIGFGDKNVFGKMRGKYLIELNNYKVSDTVYLEIVGDGVTYARTIVERPLVYKSADGDFVEYGTNTVDIGLNGEFVTINNDFPFFYNKHWVKTNFQVEEVKVRNVKFGKSAYSINEGEDRIVTVELSEPSVFGTESLVVELISSSVPDYNTAIINVDFDINNFPFGFPMNLSWNIGQQTMDIDVSALSDYIIEKSKENFSLALTNLSSSLTTNEGVVNISATTISIIDKTPKQYVNYNFQKIIRNINPVTSLIYPADLAVFPGFEMNVYGADDEVVGAPQDVNANYRFFPNDKFELKITNEGDTTTLPIIPGFTTQEQYFGVGQIITIDVTTKYVNHDSLPLEKATLDFKEKDVPFSGGSVYNDNFYINGIKFNNGPLVADDFVTKVNQKYSSLGLEVPFDMVQSFRTVVLTAKHPADNINVLIPKEEVILGLDNYALQDNRETPFYQSGVRVDSITDQLPFELKLYANNSNATAGKYKFEIIKAGYKPVTVPSNSIAASPSGTNVYLVTPIRDVKGPVTFDGTAISCHPFSYVLDSDGYYLNGVAMIARALFGATEPTATNTHTSGYQPSFLSAPLVTDVNTCSNNDIGVSKTLS